MGDERGEGEVFERTSVTAPRDEEPAVIMRDPLSLSSKTRFRRRLPGYTQPEKGVHFGKRSFPSLSSRCRNFGGRGRGMSRKNERNFFL